MRRIAVVGPSGAGKSTLARSLSTALDAPHLELDGLFHQADWTQLETEEFQRRVAAFIEQESWVVDGNYRQVRELVFARADMVVWLRPDRALVMRQVVRRTLSRMAFRTELWNGNRERLRNVLSLDPERSILAWAWSMHGSHDEEYTARAAEPPAGQRWVVLRDRRQVEAFLEEPGY